VRGQAVVVHLTSTDQVDVTPDYRKRAAGTVPDAIPVFGALSD
jgi:hypothetical protein